MKPQLTSLKSLGLILGCLWLVACGSKDSGMAVCVFDKAALIDAPSKKDSKWLSSISVGEKLDFLGSSETETVEGKERTYYKVKLIDGKEGWVQADFVATKSFPAVATEKIDLYNRPDLSSITKKTFEPMDVFALGEVKDDWVAIVGKRKGGKWIDKGWIKNKGYSDKENDIAAAIFIKRAVANGSKSAVIKDLKAILENPELSGSAFESNINEMLAKLEPAAQPAAEPSEEGAEEPVGE